MTVVPIVEGHAEVESIPLLIRRVRPDLMVSRPFRVKRNRVVRPGEIERVVQLAHSDREGVARFLVVLDADDDCPADLAPKLSQRCRAVTHLPVSVVLAKRELEAWFLGALESLRGTRGIRADAAWAADPESPRDAKGRLEQFMAGRTYVEVDDQPALAAAFDLESARARCPSLDKLLREVETF